MSFEKYPGEYVVVSENIFENNITFWRAYQLSKIHGISREEILKRQKSNNGSLVFRRVHFVKYVFSEEELLAAKDADTIQTLAQRHQVSVGVVKKARHNFLQNKARCAASASPINTTDDSDGGDDDFTSKSEQSTCTESSEPWALAFVCRASDRTHFASLYLLCEVQEERGQEGRGAHHAYVSRLQLLPLPVLSRCARLLHEARDIWNTRVCSLGAAAQERLACTAQAEVNVLLYNVCLWQRRHPLPLVGSVLQLQHTQPQIFPQQPLLLAPVMHNLLESLSTSMYCELSTIPSRVRCDVLMTYPHVEYKEQLRVMRDIVESAVASNLGSDRDSAHPVTPQELLKDYLPPTSIPERFCPAITEDVYRAIRSALERHKRDGVIRIGRGYVSTRQ